MVRINQRIAIPGRATLPQTFQLRPEVIDEAAVGILAIRLVREDGAGTLQFVLEAVERSLHGLALAGQLEQPGEFVISMAGAMFVGARGNPATPVRVDGKAALHATPVGLGLRFQLWRRSSFGLRPAPIPFEQLLLEDLPRLAIHGVLHVAQDLERHRLAGQARSFPLIREIGAVAIPEGKVAPADSADRRAYGRRIIIAPDAHDRAAIDLEHADFEAVEQGAGTGMEGAIGIAGSGMRDGKSHRDSLR